MKCDSCKNKSFCKYTEECKEIDQAVNDLNSGKDQVFKVSLSCSYFEAYMPVIKNPLCDSLNSSHSQYWEQILLMPKSQGV